MDVRVEPDWVQTDEITRLRERLKNEPLTYPSTADMASAMDAMGRQLVMRPLAQRYLAKVRALGDKGSRIYSAGDVLGERELRVGTMLWASDSEFDDASIPRRDRLPFAMRALAATPYLWTSRCYEMARTVGVPKHTISRSVLPEPRMWWTLETAYTSTDVHTGQEVSLDGYLLSDEGPEGFTVWSFGQSHGDKRIMLEAGGFRYGRVFPDEFPETVRESCGQLLSMLAFLNSPYIPKSTTRLTRSERRANVRAVGPEHHDDSVTFVDLRAPVPGSGEPHASESREWQHRWIVRGHNRAQWYPSEQAHHVIYIAPYIKGPEDAPLLQHAYRVRR